MKQAALFAEVRATPPLVSSTEARLQLAALRIKSGLVPGRAAELGAFSVSIGHSSEAKSFTASVWRTLAPRTRQTMGLTKEDVETRGRSLWITGNTWRLTTAGIDKLITNLINVDVVNRDDITPKPTPNTEPQGSRPTPPQTTTPPPTSSPSRRRSSSR